MLHFSKMGFLTEEDPSSCMYATMRFVVLKGICRGRYNTILSLLVSEDSEKQHITSLNGSTGKLCFTNRSLFQATIQLSIGKLLILGIIFHQAIGTVMWLVKKASFLIIRSSILFVYWLVS